MWGKAWGRPFGIPFGITFTSHQDSGVSTAASQPVGFVCRLLVPCAMGSTVSSRNAGRIAPMDRWKNWPRTEPGSLGVGLPLISGDVFVGCKNWFIEKMDDIYLQYSFWGRRWGMSCSERSYGKSQNVINMKDFSHQTGMTTWRLASCCKLFQGIFFPWISTLPTSPGGVITLADLLRFACWLYSSLGSESCGCGADTHASR